MKRNYIFYTLIIVTATIFLSGCNEFKYLFFIGDVPNWTISIHKIVRYPRATNLEMEIKDRQNRSIWIIRTPELSSHYIKEIRPIPIKGKMGYYKLQLILDEDGAMDAIRLCNDRLSGPWACLINGKFYNIVTFYPKPLDKDYMKIIIDGAFDKFTARHLKEYAEKNYIYYHRND